MASTLYFSPLWALCLLFVLKTGLALDATAETCSKLSLTLQGKVFFPREQAYDAVEKNYYSLQEQLLTPSCIVEPYSVEEVASAIKILKAHGTKFAVTGGGHNLNAGWANIQGGVTITLRSIKSTFFLNNDQSIVSIGGGAIWGDVYSYLDTYGLGTSGGRWADVGVGGLSTGGGVSWFSGTQGFVCDNVVNHEIVLGNGTIVQANYNHNRELWIALKGGFNNFGIVTRFDVKTFPIGDFFGGVLIYDGSTAYQQIQALVDLDKNYDPNAAAIVNLAWNQKTNAYTVIDQLHYTKPNTNPAAFGTFFGLQPQTLNTMRISNLTDFALESADLTPKGVRSIWLTTTFKADINFAKSVYDKWNATVEQVRSIKGLNWAITLQPIPPAFSSKTASMGGNSLGLDPADAPLILLLLSAAWDNESDTSKVNEVARKLIANIDSAAAAARTAHKFKYLNYADSSQDPISGYGAGSKLYLQAVSRKYDPEGVFQKLVPGGFKVLG